MASPLTLYEFRLSHFCEKSRWALEYFQIPYESKVLLPGPHAATIRRLGARRTAVPVLTTDEAIVQGSSAIIDWAELRLAKTRLTPMRADERRLAFDWEDRAGKEVGRSVRVVLYQHLLEARSVLVDLMTQDGPWYGRTFYAATFPALRAGIRAGYKINPTNAAIQRGVLEEFLDDLDVRLAESPWIAGDEFSRADISVGALLAPLVMPPEHPLKWPELSRLPDPVRLLRQTHSDRRWFEWVSELYRTKRHIEG